MGLTTDIVHNPFSQLLVSPGTWDCWIIDNWLQFRHLNPEHFCISKGALLLICVNSAGANACNDGSLAGTMAIDVKHMFQHLGERSVTERDMYMFRASAA